MRPVLGHEFPAEQESAYRRARRLELWTIAYLVSVIIVMYLAMGSSQAMKTAWVEDALSLVAPISFLVASRVARREPTPEFPYGYHRSVTIAFLVGSVALFGIGAYLLVDGAKTLIAGERASIGTVDVLGETVWLGWLMLAALTWSAIPAMLLGHAKLPLSERIHDKLLHTDAVTNKADWMTAVGAMAGVVGIGLGLWWADAVAAILISLDITYDGAKNLSNAVTDLMDREPRTVDFKQRDPLLDRVREELEQLDWVEKVEVRLREDGHVYFGEAFVVPADASDLVRRIEEAGERIRKLHWRIGEVVITAVQSLEPIPGPGA